MLAMGMPYIHRDDDHQANADRHPLAARKTAVAPIAWLALIGALTGPIVAQVLPRAESPAAAKAFRHPDLHVPSLVRPLDRLPAAAAERARQRMQALGVGDDRALLDLRGERWGTLVPEVPLIPGGGRGNDLQREPGGGSVAQLTEVGQAAWEGLLTYLRQNEAALNIDVAELGAPRLTVSGGGDLVQIYVPRLYQRIPVRDSALSAVVNHGNLILLGTRNWGEIRLAPRPQVSPAAARASLRAHLAPVAAIGFRSKARQIIVPMAAEKSATEVRPGHGYRYRLTWVLHPELAGDSQNWEALVDAHTGELLAFQDTNRYATARRVIGGVLPMSNDGEDPGGAEQNGYPMPYADVEHGGRRSFTDSGGNLPLCVDASISTTLDGRFARIVDVCGPLSESSTGDLDLGTSAGTDCAVPPGASPGNTRSARTVFHELNRMREQALGRLLGNGWVNNQLIGITNFPADLLGCNAFWDGSTVTFFVGDPTFPPAGCSNTGELATVVDHEWAHGLDDNDANGEISTPGEGIADILSALRFNDSCIGRGFFKGTPCDNGDTDPCLTCDGVRDIDYEKRDSGQPHDILFIDTFCPPGDFSAPGPCGGAIHCEGALESETAWDLLHRELPAQYSMDFQTALEVTTRLFYLGSGMVSSWFQCVPGSGTGDGCNADGGYLNLLAVDDDNGSLGDGTPHMTAIHAAFARHGIACDTLTVQDSGCAGGPVTSPTLTVEPLDRGTRLTWTPVSGAAKYVVLRNEGVLGCEAGKARVGETDGLEFVDEGLLNGFDYYYVVVPVGSSDSCLGPASSCAAVTPAPGANLALDPVSAGLTILDGDGDGAIDNCETAELGFDLHNIGVGTLTDVRINGVEVLSSAGTVDILSSFPRAVAPSLEDCVTARGSFRFRVSGLSFNEALEFRVRFTADELGGLERSNTLRIEGTESDVAFFASKTFDFETDMEGWQVVQGTFGRAGGEGGDGTDYHLASSNDLPGQCDQVHSPLLRLSDTSTLSVWTSFDIEGPFTELPPYIFWFDRANVALHLDSTGQRFPVVPDAGRPYNAGGTDGSCITQDQEGWADSMPAWEVSTWSTGALTDLVAAGQLIRLDMGYGTDDCGPGCDAVEGFGFRFDQVTITDVELVDPDVQSDVCEGMPECGNGIVESGEDCDDGDTQPGDCCAADCTFEAAGSTCGDPADTDCDNPDGCNGLGTCGSNYETAGAACGDQGLECLVDDACDGAGQCTDNGFEADGTACGDPSDTDCDNPDSCLTGACEPNYETAATTCDDGQFCTLDEVCDGSGVCGGGSDRDCGDGVTCTDDACDEDTDSCDNVANDANCPDDGEFCTGAEFCDAAADCSSTGDPCLAGEICNEGADICEAAQSVLTVTKVGSGSGTVGSDPNGIDCGTDCMESYDPGTEVTLTAMRDSGSTFDGWSGDCSGTLASASVSMDVDKTCAATFAECVPLKDVSGQMISDAQSFEACSALTAGSLQILGPGGVVTFTAGAEIILKDGFVVDAGATFTAVIDPSLTP